MTKLSPGDELAEGQEAGLRQFEDLPEGTILEAISDDVMCVAYRVTTFEWTVTGHDSAVTSRRLMQFSDRWRVIRLGQHDASDQTIERTYDSTNPEHIPLGTVVQVAFNDHDLAGQNVIVLDNDAMDGITMHRVRYVTEAYVMHDELRWVKQDDGTWERVDR